MSGSNVPPPTFTNAGFVITPESEILGGVQADWAQSYSSLGTLNTALETLQGQVISSEAAIIGNAQSQFVALANGVDPALSTGRMQDAIGRIYFITRLPAEPTTVACVCSGSPGVVIPSTALLQDPYGNTFVASSAATISGGGTVALSFSATTTGPLAVASNSLSIYQTIPGWDSVSNSAGVLGQNVETASEFETRRKATVANQSNGSNGAILGNILNLPVSEIPLDAYVVSNDAGTSTAYGTVTLSANAVYVGYSGGNPAAIAFAAWQKKAPGPPWFSGNGTYTIIDPNPYYNGSGPSYTVQINSATSTPVNTAVNLKNSPAVPSNALALVTAAINAAYAGTDGLPRASRIGQTVYASRFYPGIAAALPGVNIIDILIGTGSPSSYSQTIEIDQISTSGYVTLTLT